MTGTSIMPISDWPELERPREKLLALGAHALSEAELLAIFLRTGVKGKSAVDLARDLLIKFKTLNQLLNASQQTFCEAHGLGIAKYVQMQAVLEISRRNLYQTLPGKITIENVKQTKNFLKSSLTRHEREVFACLFLDSRHSILSFEELFYGTISSATVHPREIVKRALHHNAAAVILAHNHPSGDTQASNSDKAITHKLIDALKLIDVRVLDHIIVGGTSAMSFMEMGLM
jgi:DNA repair protein RadC